MHIRTSHTAHTITLWFSRRGDSILIGLCINVATARNKQDALPPLDAIVRVCVMSQPWQIPRLLYICSIACCDACDVLSNISLSLKELCTGFSAQACMTQAFNVCTYNDVVADFTCQNRNTSEMKTDIVYIYRINLKSFLQSTNNCGRLEFERRRIS